VVEEGGARLETTPRANPACDRRAARCDSGAMARVAIVGGGIAGLAAAHALADDHEVLVLESSDRVGGKLRSETIAGVRVDVGAEAMLNRRPEGVELARTLGLAIVHPTTATSRIWARGALRPLPRSLMGVPLDGDDLARSHTLSPEGLATALAEKDLPPSQFDDDRTIGDLVAERFGPEVVDRLVEPLLGGVYAGHAREISCHAALPQLASLASKGSILAQSQHITGSYAAEHSPVFAAIDGGMGRFPEALAADPRIAVRTRAVVRRLTRSGHGFTLTLGATNAEETLTADAVIVAAPASAAARLLGDLAPAASAELVTFESASVAVVTFAFRADDLPDGLDEISGVLVPPIEERDIKASTLSFAKWDWVRAAGGDLRFLRTSLGRHREEASLQHPDEELVRRSRADLADLLTLSAEPVEVHVQRWGGGLPQYALGHLDRVARIRESVAQVPGLAICGAAYDGVGIPAVIASAQAAATRIRG
jgi:oxygen-dependent protoporphyrinogen oxidase